ncbi:MAG: secretin N-terminal domain-containing protein [Candidatus Omnitrophica bacterium]|nr:secretin N-terminal domain-containing protein [Candidatus Omnitrophota bacterium]
MFKLKTAFFLMGLLSCLFSPAIAREEGLPPEEQPVIDERFLEEMPPEEWMKQPEPEEGMLPETEPLFSPPSASPQVPEDGRQEGKISLDIKGMNILDVLKLISQRSGMNIVAGRNVSGRVTMFIRDVEPIDALEVILAANGLAYEKKGGIINIMSARDYELAHGDKFDDKKEFTTIKLQYAQAATLSKALTTVKSALGKVVVDESSNTLIILDMPEKIKQMKQIIKDADKPIVTKVFNLQYGTAEDMKAALQEKVTKNIGTLTIDARTNKLAIRDYPEKINELTEVIQQFDEKPKQVLIEARIIKIDLDDEFKFGIDWDYWLEKYFRVTQSFKPTASKGTATVFTFGPSTINAKEEYRGIMNMISYFGKTETLSTPRIIVLNNQEAKVLLGNKESYIESTTSQSGTGTQVTAQEIKFIEGGVKLSVTPTINDEGYITMKIKPEVSTAGLTPITVSGQTTQVPTFNTSEAESTVMVKDGATILIAGLIKNVDTKSRNKIPLMGDVPLIGNLFRQNNNLVQKNELVIFLTPTIVSGSKVVEYKGEAETPRLEDMQRDAADDPMIKKAALPSEGFRNFLEYSDFVSRKISQTAKENAGQTSESGRVTVSFILLSTGEIQDKPRVVSSTNELLNNLALKNVMESAPFPPFYRLSEKNMERFRIAISYN